MHKTVRRPLDPVHAMLLGNLVWGVVLGLGFAGGVYLLDLGHIRTLVSQSPDGLLAMALLSAGSVITFASVVMGGAEMLIPGENEPRSPRGGKGMLLRALVPLRATASVRGVASRHRAASRGVLR